MVAEDGRGGRERREAGEGAAAGVGRLLVYWGEKAGGRVQRKGEGGGCGKDGDAADTGECTTTEVREGWLLPPAPSRDRNGVEVAVAADCSGGAGSAKDSSSSLISSDSERRSGGRDEALEVSELSSGGKEMGLSLHLRMLLP